MGKIKPDIPRELRGFNYELLLFLVFDEKCKCGVQEYPQWFKDGEKVMVVNCTNSGFNDNTTMLKQLPRHTQVLLFNGNKIPYLDWNVFGVWDDHVDLKVIDLSNNQIEDIDGKAFHKVSNGEYIQGCMVSLIVL